MKNQRIEKEEVYLPFGKQYLILRKDLERPNEAAESLIKSSKKKVTDPKAKAAKKRKATPN